MMTGQVLLIIRLLLAASLYAFLGWAILTLWRDLKRQGEHAATRLAPTITLEGSDGTGVYEFIKPEILIGRDQAHDITLNDKTVSTQHARLSYHHHQWWIEDLDSTNGTFLPHEHVSTPIVIASGDQMRCGQVVFTITIEENPD